MENNQNQNQTPKKGLFEQLKGLGLWGYLGLCVVAEAAVRIIEAIFGSLRKK